MRLYIDQGNSRIKLWLLDDAGLQAESVCVDVGEVAGWLASIAERSMSVMSARVACVATPQRRADLASVLRAHVEDVAFAQVEPARLPTAYADPARLGVDRWLVVLAAAVDSGPALVVDAGTAFTVDALSADGCHLGGYILPGLTMQRDALAARTAQVSFPEPDWSGLGWGESTAGSVGHGALLALSALVEAASRRLQVEAGRSPRLLLTGGDARLLAPWLPGAERHACLVLEGLAAYFHDEPARLLARRGGRV